MGLFKGKLFSREELLEIDEFILFLGCVNYLIPICSIYIPLLFYFGGRNLIFLLWEKLPLIIFPGILKLYFYCLI